MAENIETINVLRIDGTTAITTLRELKAAIIEDRDALVALGNVEANDVKKKAEQDRIIGVLTQHMKLLNDVMKASQQTTVASAKAVDLQTASYNTLQKSLTTLKKAWKDMTAEERASAEGTEILQKIKQLDASLKTLDADIGQYQRNVGNYGQTFQQSLEQAQKGASGLTAGLSAMTGILAITGDKTSGVDKVLRGLAAAMAMFNAGKGILEFITKTREANKALKAAGDAGKAATATTKAGTVATEEHAAAMEADAVATTTASAATKAFRAALMATGIGALLVLLGELIANFDKLGKAIGLVDEEMQKHFKDMEDGLNAVETEIRQNSSLMEALGKDSLDIMSSEIDKLGVLKKRWYDLYTESFSYYNNLTLLEQWSDDLSDAKIDEFYQKHVEIGKELETVAQNAYNGLVKIVAAANKAKNNEGLTDMQIALDAIDTKAQAAVNVLDSLINHRLINNDQYNDMVHQLGEAFDYERDQVKKRDEERKKEEAKRAAERAAADAKRAKERYDAEVKSAQALEEQARKAMLTERERLDEKYREDLARLQQYGIDSTNLTAKYQADIQALTDKAMKERADAQAKDEAEMLAAQKAAYEAARSAAKADLDAVSAEEEQKQRLNDISRHSDRKKDDEAYRIAADANQKRIDLLKQFQAEAEAAGDAEAALQYQQQAADLSVEIELQAAEEKERIRQRDAGNAKEAARQTVDSVAGIFDALADIYESDTKASEKEKKRAKNLRIAAATIDMLSGAVTAFATAQELGPYLGPIVGAVNAAAVIAAGTANIRKIKSQQVSASSGSTQSASVPATPSVSAPDMTPDITQVRTITGASEEERLNQPNRVYILQSDIEAAAASSQARVAESTF